jgi:hypothetical protein
MTEARLVASLWVSALLRRAEAEGMFATVMRRGDPVAGAVAVVLRGRDGPMRILARVADATGSRWATARDALDEAEVTAWVDRQARYDPDLWVVELLGEDAERLVVELPRTD